MTDSYDTQLKEFVTRYSKLAVLTGAGVSTASGLGDYRDRLGQWKRKQPITGQTFNTDEAARKRYWARSCVGWPAFSQALPGESHKALHRLEQADYIELLITQNVDRLHQKAGHKNVIDLHGTLASVSCNGCGHTVDRDSFQTQLLQQNEWLTKLTAAHAPDGDADLELESLSGMHIPACPHCANILKPDVVFFGENVPKQTVSLATQAVAKADALVVVGSSLMVYSGFRFCRQAYNLNKPIVIINNGKTRADDLATLKIQGDCGQRLSTLVNNILLATTAH